MRIPIVWRVLCEKNTGNSCQQERSGIGREDGAVIDLEFAKSIDGLGESSYRRNNLAMSHDELIDRALPGVKNHSGKMMFHLILMSFRVCARSEEALLFTGE